MNVYKIQMTQNAIKHLSLQLFENCSSPLWSRSIRLTVASNWSELEHFSKRRLFISYLQQVRQ